MRIKQILEIIPGFAFFCYDRFRIDVREGGVGLYQRPGAINDSG